MKISLIWAMSRNRVIGKCNRLPWRLPDELLYFRNTVRGNPIIMGRRTFEGIGKPLSGCLNIVLSTSNVEFPGCVHAKNLDAALEFAQTTRDTELIGEIFVIGGSAVYEAALPQAHRLYRTIVEAKIEGDTFFPSYDESDWSCIGSERHASDARHQYSFRMEVFEREPNDSSLV